VTLAFYNLTMIVYGVSVEWRNDIWRTKSTRM